MSAAAGETSVVSEIFRRFDVDGSGTIERARLLHVMASLGIPSQTTEELLLGRGEDVRYEEFIHDFLKPVPSKRMLSLPKSVATAGGIDRWNERAPELAELMRMLDGMCVATTVDQALKEIAAITSLGHNLWAYAYMRRLYNRSQHLYYATLIARPSLLLPVVYTPTVGEACQKFGKMPMYRRGCYLCIEDRGRFKEVLREYAEEELQRRPGGGYACDCIVFSDGGRILGLGDLAAWGMGIPIGKLDLYTVCAGVNPYRTIPVILDVGCYGPEGNTDRLEVRDHKLYTGFRQNRQVEKSAAGTVVNSAYYGEGNAISEFMQAATELFGKTCLLQFEDFNSNDAFPLLAEYRNRYLTYNDDIQGTAAVVVAGLLGALKLRDPSRTDLVAQLRQERFLFHGAGSANLGVVALLRDEAGVDASRIFVTNSRGLIWRSADGAQGSFRNEEQKGVAVVGEPTFDSKSLETLVENVKPTCLVGAVGVAPGCFTKAVVETAVRLNPAARPVIFALSNPQTQAEIKAKDAYDWSGGKVIYGSGTMAPAVEVGGRRRVPGQVNNVYIFPGVSFGAVACEATSVPNPLFMTAAEAVANSLDDKDVAADSVLPARDQLREASLNVATAVVLKAQELGIAGKKLGDGWGSVKKALDKLRWAPGVS